ncbi:hypothetical protein A4X09_0g4885 [Tilletia walkeri]|uniref:Uncharacterized protein n=1 Tax=Tilletia walkeri TaxID=117179 RepID=A0A8X7T3G0_9BASI|nr:hypothetical protein A4X09_0g4885 [Tilletia walkeri]
MIPSVSVLPSQASGAKGFHSNSTIDQTGVRTHTPKQDPAAAPTRLRQTITTAKKSKIPITIDGDEIGIVAERASKSTVRMTEIAHSLYPSIQGPKNVTLSVPRRKRLPEIREVSFRIPPRAALPSTRKVTPADADDRATDSTEADSGTSKARERDPATILSAE